MPRKGRTLRPTTPSPACCKGSLPTALWREAQAFVDRQRGLLVLDDTTLDKP